ncbi:hypothetical protein RND71_029672 [Anisodus tanguticus]|uniref:Mitochondrial import inner membrane translocase subunit TIM50 n=1 Tax=Anisodus tanguticus TaxID=243964 RepID=A0AAE1RFN2_9SOLA|nr:hypothetical protein RND71_029672 [Anisodus tanguticus]
MYPRPRVLITYCRKRRNSTAPSSSIPETVEDAVTQESKTKSTNIHITLPDESTVFASDTRSRQMYPRPRVLITYCRKRRRGYVALESSIPAIVEDAVIQESKTKSTNMDITLPAESSEFIERRRISSVLGNSVRASLENVGSSVVIQESKTPATNLGPLSLSFCSEILQEVITRDGTTSVGARQILVKAACESSSVEHRNEKKILAVDNSRENSNSSVCDTIKNVAHHVEFAKDGYVRACAFGSSTNEILDGERQSLAESNSSSSRLCAFIDEKTEITNVGTVPPLSRTLNRRSNKKLLVLDLNGLLADIVPLQHVLYGFKVDTIVSGKAVFKRPFHDDFMQFCFEKFNVGVWSSRIRKNVDLVLDFLLGMPRKNCSSVGLMPNSVLGFHLFLPGLKLYFIVPLVTSSQILTLNYIRPEGDLRVYLDGLSMAENVQKYVEGNPFGQRPITEKNVSWRYYCKVIEAATYSRT